MSEEIPTDKDMVAMVSSMPWWLVLIWGILALLIGIALVGSPVVTTFYLILFMGVYWFIGGIFTLVSLLSDRSNLGWKIFLGLISIIGGIAIMGYPIYSSYIVITMMVIFAGVWGLLIGGTKIYEAIKFHDAGGGILGVLSVIFGIILLIYPYMAAVIIPWIAGLIAMLVGISAIVVSFMVRKNQSVN